MLFESSSGKLETWSWTKNTRKYVRHSIRWNLLKLFGKIKTEYSWICGDCNLEFFNIESFHKHSPCNTEPQKSNGDQT